MKYTYEELETIADATGRDCHLCHQPIDFDGYGDRKNPDGWQVDHVRPKSKGGHNGYTNLRAAHSYCNQSKGNKSNRSVRSKFKVKGMPASTSTRIWKGLGYAALTVGLIILVAKAFESPKPTQNVQV